jgi:hypothetical protein
MTSTVSVDVLDAPPPRRFRLLDVQRMAVKAALASAFAVLLARLVHNGDPLSAGFVSLVCVAPSAFGGLKRGFEQLASSFIGAAVATVIVTLVPGVRESPMLPLAIAPAMFVALVLCLQFLSDSAYFTAGFSALYVFIMPFPTGGESLRQRMVAVACGVVAAGLTNALAAALLAPTIVRRRRSIVREATAEALRARSQSLVGKLAAEAAYDAHHHALAVIGEASFDFGDSAREAFFPGAARSRHEALAALREARLFDELLHVVAPLAFAEAPQASLARWAVALDTLADALRYGATLTKARALATDALAAEQNLVAAAQGRLLLTRLEAYEALPNSPR